MEEKFKALLLRAIDLICEYQDFRHMVDEDGYHSSPEVAAIDDWLKDVEALEDKELTQMIRPADY